MIGKGVFNLVFILSVAGVAGQPGFNQTVFYSVMASGNTVDIDRQLSLLKGAGLPEKKAYEGALLMRKAGMVKKAKDKLSLFKAGRSLLETSIGADNDNTEYRFLRLIIQEHAPAIVQYRNKIEQDSRWIQANFKHLSPLLQQQVIDYSKKSKVLKTPVYNFLSHE